MTAAQAPFWPQSHYRCESYHGVGLCTHQAAPRRLLGPAKCILWLHEHRSVNSDPRVVKDMRCALYTPSPLPHQPDPNP